LVPVLRGCLLGLVLQLCLTRLVFPDVRSLHGDLGVLGNLSLRQNLPLLWVRRFRALRGVLGVPWGRGLQRVLAYRQHRAYRQIQQRHLLHGFLGIRGDLGVLLVLGVLGFQPLPLLQPRPRLHVCRGIR